MKTMNLGTSNLKVSVVGIGGHYKRMEEGMFEERYAKIDDKEVEERIVIFEKAFLLGVNYFDTTWRNEVVMLDKVINRLNIRDSVFINGMVLGAFSGSKYFEIDVERYFNHWLDERLKVITGNRLDSVMINAIEEEFDQSKCERLIRIMEKRKANGDIGLYGFSSHDSIFARKISDMYKEFIIIMLPYNFRNRVFEEAFKDYSGDASFIAMKPLVWAEYGIPFCALNRIQHFRDSFGFSPDESAATKAFEFILENPRINALVCAVNSEKELNELLAVGNNNYTQEDYKILQRYNTIQTFDNGIPLFVSGLLCDNLRSNYFAIMHIYRALEIETPEISLNLENSRELIHTHTMTIANILIDRGYGKYAKQINTYLYS